MFNTADNLEKLVIETLFMNMCQLPKIKLPTVFYASVLQNLIVECEDAKTYIVECSQSIFKNLNHLQNDFIEILSDFVVFYLNNNHIQWDWNQYSEVADQEDFSHQRYYLKVLFEKLCNTIQNSKLKDELPLGLQDVLPPSSDNKTVLKYLNNQEDDECKEAQFIYDKLVSKIPAKDMLAILQNPGEYDLNIESYAEGYQIFFECLFKRMCPTFTHLNILFERYMPLFEALNEKQDFQRNLINSISDFWSKSSLHFEKYLQKFQQKQFISYQVLFDWLFQKVKFIQNTEQCYFFWNLLYKIFDRVSNNIEIVQKEINEANKDSIQEDEVYENAMTKKINEAIQLEKDIFVSLMTNFKSLLIEEDYREFATVRFKQFIRIFPKIYAKYADLAENQFKDVEKNEVKELLQQVKTIY